MKSGKSLKKEKKVKHKSFYIYQIADIIFTSSCRSVGMLLAWVMINYHSLKVELGWFITSSWAIQVITLILFSSLSEKFNKKNIILLCVMIASISLISLNFDHNLAPFKLGAIYIVTSLLCIVVQPIGSSIVPTLYEGNDLERAFRIRGFVNSINTVIGAIVSGFVIKFFSPQDTVLILSYLSVLSLLLFMSVKIKTFHKEDFNTDKISSSHILVKNRVERLLVSVSALSNFIITPTLMYIAPILVIENYGLSSLELGASEATFGLGMVFGSMFLCNKINNFIGVRYSTVMSIVLVSFGLLSVLVIDNIYALYIGFFICGLGMVMYNINTTKIRCSATPSDIRNSFESIFLAVCILPIPAGVAFSTYMIDIGGTTNLLIFFSTSIIIASILVLRSNDFAIVSLLKESELDGYYSKMYPEAYLNNLQEKNI